VSKSSKDIITPDRKDLVAMLKRIAKREKNNRGKDTQLSTILNQIAVTLHYKNWSMFHRDAVSMPDDRFSTLESQVKMFPEVQEFLKTQAIDKEAATNEMQEFVESKFTPLIEFAYHDSESVNGYSWPDVDLNIQLQEEFDHKYPTELIEEVARDMELDRGPWGVEDYDDDTDDHDSEPDADGAAP